MILSEELYHLRKIDFLEEIGASKYKSGSRGEFDVGLCNVHPKQLRGSDAHYAKLSTAALFLNESFAGNLSCAISDSSTQANDRVIYVEQRTITGTVQFYYDGKRLLVNNRNSNTLEICAITAYQIFCDPELSAYYDSVRSLFFSQPGNSEIILRETLSFCDHFWYGYAKNVKAIDVNEKFSTEQVKQMYQTGVLKDVSSRIGGKECELFRDLQKRRDVKKARCKKGGTTNDEHYGLS